LPKSDSKPSKAASQDQQPDGPRWTSHVALQCCVEIDSSAFWRFNDAVKFPIRAAVATEENEAVLKTKTGVGKQTTER
jgi:hypothetical protein